MPGLQLSAYAYDYEYEAMSRVWKGYPASQPAWWLGKNVGDDRSP